MAARLPLTPEVVKTLTTRLQRVKRVTLPVGPAGAAAAVFAPLCSVNGEASMLFTLRTMHVGTHKGQVSFPGGHIDEGETPTEAALREFEEEVMGLPAAPQALGVFHEAIAVTGTHVTPVLGWVPGIISDAADLQPHEAEVRPHLPPFPPSFLCPPLPAFSYLFTSSWPCAVPLHHPLG